MKRFSFFRTCFCLSMLLMLFVQCDDHDIIYEISEQQGDNENTVDHTLLVYIAGDNSLSPYSAPNVKAMEQGLLASDSVLHLVVFEDNRSYASSSLLYRLDRHKNKIDTVVIRCFDTDLDSADPEVMKQVLQLAFEAAPASINGLVLWSHAMSWIPSTNFMASASPAERATLTDSATTVATQARKPAYFGQDGTDYMELWDLRAALETGLHLDYILVDACFFGTAEVAYELRGVTDYLMAAPTEVFGTGYPYQAMIPVLALMNQENREDVLVAAAKVFQQEYADNGTLSVIRTAGMETLVEQWRASHEKYSQVWTQIAANPYDWDRKLQHYGRRRVGAYYYFYDFADLLYRVATEAGATDGRPDVSDAVVFDYHSKVFTDGLEDLNILTSCGLGVSIPELFQLNSNASKLASAYPLTLWGQDAQENPIQ